MAQENIALIINEALACLKAQNYPAAFQKITKAKDLNIQAQDLHFVEAIYHLQLGNESEGLAALTRELEAFPNNAHALQLRESLGAPTDPQDTTGGDGHYDANYWAYQKEIGEAGGVLNLFKFEEFITPETSLMDFGCGGGFLLNNISCKERLGLEISEHARAHAKSLGLRVVADFSEVQDQSLDLIISNHALEHVPNPLSTFQDMYKKLRLGGKIAIVVPCEQPKDPNFEYREDDINQHLFTWCPATLGNLIKLAGFKVLSSEALQHQWTADYLSAYKSMPLPDYHRLCREQAQKNNAYQVRTVGEKTA